MPTIACVTAVTPDDVTVTDDGNGIRINIDSLGIFPAGITKAEQLEHLANIAHKLLNAHDAIAAQLHLFPAEVQA